MESSLRLHQYESLVQYVTVPNIVFLALGLFGLVILKELLVVLYDLFLSPLRDIPGPFWARITRLWELKQVLSGKMPQTLIALHAKYGPVVRVAPNMYSFSQPEDSKVVYTTTLSKAHAKTHFYNTNGDPNMPNIFNMKDEKMHAQRKRKIGGLYTMSTMVNYEIAVEEMNRILIRKFSEFVSTNTTLDLPKFMQFYAFDVIGKITVDKEFGMMEKVDDVDDFIRLTREAVLYMGTIGLFPELHPLLLWANKVRGAKHAGTLLVKIALDSIQKGLEGKVPGGDGSKSDSFVSKLSRMLGSEQINVTEAVDSIATNIAAGSDTTAITLSAAFYYVYRNPEILAKLRAEIDGRPDPVSFDEAQGMPYLQAVINETLRIHPAVGYILRREVPKGGSTLAGRQFPQGTQVGVSAWALHHNSTVSGPDFATFRPERWLEDDRQRNTKTAMSFAFGGGSRVCLGKNVSLLEMNKVIPQVIRSFDLVFDEGEPWDTYCNWFVWPQYKVRLQHRPRA